MLICGVIVLSFTACNSFLPLRSDNAGTAEIATRINDGMQRLGASPARGECYANRISTSLIQSEAVEAASLIERALSKDEMRENVISASTSVKQAFIKAHFGCSLSS